MNWLTRRIRSGILVAAVLPCGVAPAQQQAPAAATFSEGQKVEVREGDSWSAATVKKREGRKYLIHYEGGDDASDEWVTADRIRVTGGAGAPVQPGQAPAAAKPAAPATPAAPANAQWVAGQKVEVKWGGSWREATIVRKQGEWTLVGYLPSKTREWVEPWRIRRLGSSDDTVGIAHPNNSLRNNEGPPTGKPGPVPDERGAAAARSQDADRSAAYRDDPAFKAADASDARKLDLDIEGTLTPDAAPAQVKVSDRGVTLKGGKSQTFEAVKAVVVSSGGGGGPTAAVAHVIAPPGRGGEVRVETIDLASGKSAAVHVVAPGTALVDVAPGAKSVLRRSDEFGIGKHDRLEVWSLDGKEAKRTLVFFPYDDKDWTARDVEFAAFVGDGHVLTTSREGILACWDVATGRAVYTCETTRGSRPALSAGGRYVAIEKGKGVFVIEARTGKAVVELAVDPASAGGHAASYSFSPSGNVLAAWSGKTCRVWDLAAGKLSGEFTTYLAGQRIELLSDKYAMLDGTYLIDFDRRIPLFKYTADSAAGGDAAFGRYWFVAKDEVREVPTLRGVELPDSRARELAQSLNPDELLLLKPGTNVSLVLNLSGVSYEQRKDVEDTLKQKLITRGLVVVDNSPIRFVATTELGKMVEREYRRSGTPPWGKVDKVNVTEQKARLSIELDGKAIWETASTVEPGGFILHLKENQSVQDAVNELSKPNIPFLKSTPIPSYLAKPRDPAWYGEGKLVGK